MHKTIHLELYSDKAFSIIDGFYKGLDNWGSRQMARNQNFCEVVHEADNETVLKVTCTDTYSNSWLKSAFKKQRTDQDTRNWMAWVIKQLVRRELRGKMLDESSNWNRTCDVKIFDFSNEKCDVTVSDCYLVYDFLKSRKNLAGKYTAEHLEEIIGNKRDAISTELELARREEEKKIRDKHETVIRALENSRWTKIQESRKKIEAELDEQIKAEREAMNNELRDLREMLMIAA